ncbi:MAG TPA: oxygen-independent coproporphyrinogen III oxidase [Steroidobacteraceae bacterium]|nr:oxygen-independent coproporphyrinogen III oxidase [Steroidobacteraceae bacterium]
MNTQLEFDADLLRRYDRPGPRYTSYPSAPQFSSRFTDADFRRQAARSNQEPIPRDLSLYVHVPFCFSPCFYCGCNRIITRDLRRGAPYAERLVREAEMVAPLFDRDRDVVQLHFGGGTPNFLEPQALAGLVGSLGRFFHFSTGRTRDFSIELDPRSVRDGDIAAYAAMGFNRASFGVQDFDRAVQLAINREQSIEETLRAIEACRTHGFRSVNVDLIYGLPRQTLAGFLHTLNTIVLARPDRVAVYGYAHMPQKFKAQRQIDERELPDAAERLALLQVAIERLTAAGYCYIGLDHFALPGDDLSVALEAGTLQRNFMGYTTHAESDLIGLGASSISHVGDSYSQNHRDLPPWESAVDQGRLPVARGLMLDDDDVLRAQVIQQLMCRGHIDRALIETRFEIDFDVYFAAAMTQLLPLAADGLVEFAGPRIVATSRGRLMLRIIAMCFDRYLSTPSVSDTQPRHSRAL